MIRTITRQFLFVSALVTLAPAAAFAECIFDGNMAGAATPEHISKCSHQELEALATWAQAQMHDVAMRIHDLAPGTEEFQRAHAEWIRFRDYSTCISTGLWRAASTQAVAIGQDLGQRGRELSATARQELSEARQAAGAVTGELTEAGRELAHIAQESANRRLLEARAALLGYQTKVGAWMMRYGQKLNP